MKMSSKGLLFTEQMEGVRYQAYQDTGGVYTIGVGHTSGVYKGQTATPEQVRQWLSEDIVEAEDAVNRNVKVALSQGQFDALVDFVFNVGETQFLKSTLLRLLNQGAYTLAGNQFSRWIYDNGVKQPGLIKRAVGRQAMWNS